MEQKAPAVGWGGGQTVIHLGGSLDTIHPAKGKEMAEEEGMLQSAEKLSFYLNSFFKKYSL